MASLVLESVTSSKTPQTSLLGSADLRRCWRRLINGVLLKERLQSLPLPKLAKCNKKATKAKRNILDTEGPVDPSHHREYDALITLY